jgi:hypothetical protein
LSGNNFIVFTELLQNAHDCCGQRQIPQMTVNGHAPHELKPSSEWVIEAMRVRDSTAAGS